MTAARALTQTEQTRVLERYQAEVKRLGADHRALAVTTVIRETRLPEAGVRAVIAEFEAICQEGSDP